MKKYTGPTYNDGPPPATGSDRGAGVESIQGWQCRNVSGADAYPSRTQLVLYHAAMCI